MQRLQVFAPRETEMMIAPAARDREVEFVASGAFESPAVLLDCALEHVDRVRGMNRFFLVNDRHPILQRVTASRAAKQSRSKLAQDFVAAPESDSTRLLTAPATHSFAAVIG